MAEIVFYDETELEESAYARILLTGDPKAGKTTSVLTTAPGPVLVLNCDGAGAPIAAKRYGAKNLKILDVSSAEIWRKGSEAALAMAKRGEVRTIVIDTFTVLVNQILQLEMNRKFSGFEIWREVQDSGMRNMFRLFNADAHLFVIAHFDIADGLINVPGALKKDVPGVLHDRVHLDFKVGRKPHERMFNIGPSASGLSGGRHSHENKSIEANATLLLEELGYTP